MTKAVLAIVVLAVASALPRPAAAQVTAGTTEKFDSTAVDIEDLGNVDVTFGRSVAMPLLNEAGYERLDARIAHRIGESLEPSLARLNLRGSARTTAGSPALADPRFFPRSVTLRTTWHLL